MLHDTTDYTADVDRFMTQLLLVVLISLLLSIGARQGVGGARESVT